MSRLCSSVRSLSVLSVSPTYTVFAHFSHMSAYTRFLSVHLASLTTPKFLAPLVSEMSSVLIILHTSQSHLFSLVFKAFVVFRCTSVSQRFLSRLKAKGEYPGKSRASVQIGKVFSDAFLKYFAHQAIVSNKWELKVLALISYNYHLYGVIDPLCLIYRLYWVVALLIYRCIRAYVAGTWVPGDVSHNPRRVHKSVLILIPGRMPGPSSCVAGITT